MKNLFQTIIILSLSITLNIALSAQDDDDDSDVKDHHTFGKSFFNPRSQGSYQPFMMMGVMNQYYIPCRCSSYATFALVADGAHSFNNANVGRYFFFNDSNTMLFGNSTVPNQGNIFAQNFLLNNDFNSTITIKPKITQFIADAQCFVGLDGWVPDLYFYFHIPFCSTRWNINQSSFVEEPGTVIPANSLGNPTDQQAPAHSVAQATNGQVTFFDVLQPMHFARMDQTQTQHGIADIEMFLGYNFVNRCDCHFGMSARCIIPTGNKPNGTFLFEPIVGNGHHLEFGLGLSAHMRLWDNSCNQWLNGYLEGSIYHLCNSNQRRTFDLKKNGIGSRYLLFKRFNPDGLYAGEIVRGPNILNLECRVSNAMHAEATLMLEYVHNEWTVDIGYNVWARSHDIIRLRETIANQTFGVAGTTGTDPLTNRNRTASQTRINGDFADLIDPINVYITTADIDLRSAQHPNNFTHMIFGYWGYTWLYCHYQPFIGLGFQAEFSGQRGRSLSMTHILLKAGFSLI